MPASPWERQPSESEEAYAAFLAYRDMGVGRSLAGLRQQGGKGEAFLSRCERWSSRLGWVERARGWDNHLQRQRDLVASETAREWERRRLESLESCWRDAQALRAKLRAMLEFPVEAERAEATGAGTVTIREPARWTFDTLVRLVKAVAELESAVLAEALPRGDDAFDPERATPEECRKFLARHDGGRARGHSSDTHG